jgi:HJR/Mrr/RecB family endonuclease/superfamily II DNA or RNA helicase
MKAILDSKVNEFNFQFSCKSGIGLIPIAEWAKHEIVLPNDKHACIGPLLNRLEDEKIEVRENIVIIPHKEIAGLDTFELQQLGLPGQIPYTLSISGEGLLTDKKFKFIFYFVNHNFRPIVGTQRTGALLKVGSRQYIITEPFYSLLEGMENYNNTPPENIEGRFLAWGMLKDQLPDNILLGDYLKGIQIAKADAFTILPSINNVGEPDFEVKLLCVSHKDKNPEFIKADENEFDDSFMPEVARDNFAQQFKDFKEAHTRYVLRGNWYVVIPRELGKMLTKVREVYDKEAKQRRSFIYNPRSYIKNATDDENVADDIFELLFHESAEYSSRVKEIGLWEPPIIPYIPPLQKIQWLPDFELPDTSICIGNTSIQISPKDINTIIKDIENAIQDGRTAIDYRGQQIPASNRTIQALRGVISEIAPQLKKQLDEAMKEKSSEKIVPLIKRNLDILEHLLGERSVRGSFISWQGFVASDPLKHQTEGIQWLQEHWQEGSTGALLADDMGLGKTYQALIFLSWIKEQLKLKGKKYSPILIVAPTGLLKNWQDEHTLHLVYPGLGEPIKAYGSNLRNLIKVNSRQFKELHRGLPVVDIDKLQKADWVLTTYETLRDYQHSFGLVHWTTIVFDEAQKIKNPAVLMTEAAKLMNADFILALTGTPVENRLADLWCIVDTVKPGKLGTLKEFASLYEKNIEASSDNLPKLKSMLSVRTATPSIMLRRLKEDHLKGLPNKKIHALPKDMPELQSKTYEAVIEQAMSGEKHSGKMLETLQRLRVVSLHPNMSETDLDDVFINSSARLITTFETLDKIASQNEKALIFTETRQIQGILAQIIQKRYALDNYPLIINGEVSGDKRKQRVNVFQDRSGFDVMILSPRAGGVGLTITAANHVIHLSRWWNPAVEDQCTDRVYRIGQNKDVNVYYPLARYPHVTEQSFDLNLHDMLERKRKLSRTILAPPAFDDDDLENLFNKTVFNQPEINAEELLKSIDIMEPEAFEEWVLKQLTKRGYQGMRTPRSWDRGADGIAIALEGTNKEHLIIQCKHTQSKHLCDEGAIKQVLESLKFYTQEGKTLKPVVITNSPRFSEKAYQLASQQSVQLISRDGLLRWLNNC